MITPENQPRKYRIFFISSYSITTYRPEQTDSKAMHQKHMAFGLFYKKHFHAAMADK
jgi:hypothetical protein